MEVIKVKTVEELPSSVIDEIRRLYLEDGMSPILIIKQIEKNFGYALPGLHTLVTYLKSIKPSLSSEPDLSDSEEYEEPTPTTLAPFTGKAIAVDTSSVKSQNETLKELMKNKIEFLQNKSLSEEFDKDTEQILQRYILEFTKLTQNEVKIKDDLKDTDKVALTDVKFYINKIMSSIRSCLSKHVPDKVDAIFKDLKIQLDYTLRDIVDPHVYSSQSSIDYEKNLEKENNNDKKV